MLHQLRTYAGSIIDLLYPRLCPGCGNDLLQNDLQLCLHCFSSLPHTLFAACPDNPTEKLFSGRLRIQAAHSEFYFAKSELIQKLLHQLKYKGNHQIGHYLGTLTGETLLASNRFSDLDYVIPLPLHPSKEFKRGYNQAAIIAQGISEIMKIPVLEKCIIKKTSTQTQTKKNRINRWRNVSESFSISDPKMLTGKNILLVDDVITTGATLEACGNVILSISGVRLSVVSLAYASK